MAITAWAEPERFAVAGSVADGMKPCGFTWWASQTAAALAAVVGSLLVGAPAAGVAVSNTNPTATKRNRVLRMSSSLIVPGHTGEDSSTTGVERSRPADPRRWMEQTRPAGIPARSEREPTAYGCGSAPDFDRLPPHDAAPLDHPTPSPSSGRGVRRARQRLKRGRMSRAPLAWPSSGSPKISSMARNAE